MIVTCPGCASKYRVNNDAVPAEGSRMRCPKCETLFLAKPPAAGLPGGATDDAAALQQLVPAPMATVPAPSGAPQFPPLPPFPAPLPPPPRAATPGMRPGAAPGAPGIPGVPAQPQAAGPITALFAAFDPNKLPPEMQRAPQPTQPAPGVPAPQGASSGLDLDAAPFRDSAAPKVRVASPSTFGPPSSSPSSPSRSTPRVPERRRGGDSLALVAASWLGVVVGLAGAAGGVAFAAWTLEAADLDAAMMPRFERTFGVEPPFSHVGRGEVSVDDLRRSAEEAATRGDAAAAIVLWSRVRAHQPADPRAAAAIAKLRTELEDNEG